MGLAPAYRWVRRSLTLKCRPCNQTFTAAVPEVDTGREMTERLARWIGHQSLELSNEL